MCDGPPAGPGGGGKMCSGAWKRGPESPVGVISLWQYNSPPTEQIIIELCLLGAPLLPGINFNRSMDHMTNNVWDEITVKPLIKDTP